MRRCLLVLFGAGAALVMAACGGRSHPPAATSNQSPAVIAAPASTPVATAAAARSATAAAANGSVATPLVKRTAGARQPAARSASLALTASQTVTLTATGGSFTYTYSANFVPVDLDGDGTFASTAPVNATLEVNGNGCTFNLKLVNPQIEIAGSLSDDGGSLRLASIRVSQDDVSGSAACNGAQAAPDLGGIGAGTANLSPAAPVAIRFSDGASVSLPQPAAFDRYPSSVSTQWNGSVRLSVPGS